jgi:hypothetical protein
LPRHNFKDTGPFSFRIRTCPNDQKKAKHVGFSRFLLALKTNSNGGVYLKQGIYPWVQKVSGAAGNLAQLLRKRN